MAIGTATAAGPKRGSSAATAAAAQAANINCDTPSAAEAEPARVRCRSIARCWRLGATMPRAKIMQNTSGTAVIFSQATSPWLTSARMVVVAAMTTKLAVIMACKAMPSRMRRLLLHAPAVTAIAVPANTAANTREGKPEVADHGPLVTRRHRRRWRRS